MTMYSVIGMGLVIVACIIGPILGNYFAHTMDEDNSTLEKK